MADIIDLTATFLSHKTIVSADIIDSCDVIARINKLESARQSLVGTASLAAWNARNRAELSALKALNNAGAIYEGWGIDAILIKDTYFETHTRNTASRLHPPDIHPHIGWPFDCIDWAQAAQELKKVYAAIKFGEVIYWILKNEQSPP